MDRYNACADFVLSTEGGYVNHPADPGGATNHGVSLRFASSIGRVLDLDHDGDVDEADIQLITPAVARGVFRTFFWDRVGAAELPAGVDLLVFDAAVHCGVGAASRWLQACAGVTVDGQLGPITRAALRLKTASAAGARALAIDFHGRRIAHHAGLPNQKDFGLGWSRRLAELAMVAALALPRPPQTRSTETIP